MTNEDLVKLYQEGNRQALDELLDKNKGIVYKIANKFYVDKTSSIDKDDLIQEGYIGLMYAAKKYKSDMMNKSKFSTYAVYWVYQKIHRYIKQKNTNDETSLNAPTKINEDVQILDTIEGVDYSFENIEDKVYLKQLKKELDIAMFTYLTLREREVLKLHYGWDTNPATFQFIGDILGITQVRVRQIEVKALRQLRNSKWARIEGRKYILGIRHSPYDSYKSVERRMDFIDKYFTGIV